MELFRESVELFRKSAELFRESAKLFRRRGFLGGFRINFKGSGSLSRTQDLLKLT